MVEFSWATKGVAKKGNSNLSEWSKWCSRLAAGSSAVINIWRENEREKESNIVKAEERGKLNKNVNTRESVNKRD